MFDLLAPGATVGSGTLPHHNLASSVDFAFDAFDVPTAPTLPRRDPAATGVAQVLRGVPGVSVDAAGDLSVDLDVLDPAAPVLTGLDQPGFEGLRAFADRCRRRQHVGPLHWSLAGPLATGRALCELGVPAQTAFAVSVAAVRAHLLRLSTAFEEISPRIQQLIVLDEMGAGDPFQLPPADGAESALAPGEATDVLSTALAAVERVAVVGVRAGSGTDVPLLLDAGPRLIEIPTTADPRQYAGYLATFLGRGGWVTWGVVDTDGPIVDTPTRGWRRLSNVWCTLVQCGCDAQLLRRQALFAPSGSLAAHTPAGAAQIAATVADIARLVRAEAGAARFVLGA